MENNQKPTAFTLVFAEKSDVENTTDYTLSEYMPDIAKIVRTEAKLKIIEKTVQDGKAELFGEIIYNVLYSSENGGMLKNACFREDFDKSYDLKAEVGERPFIYVKSSLIHASARAENKRTMSCRSKFSLSVEVFDMSEKSFFEDDDHTPDCDVEYLRKEVDAAVVKLCEGRKASIEESFEIDSGMAELSDIVDSQGEVCVKSVSVYDDKAEITAEMTLYCLYEAKTENGGEYVSLEKSFPFKTEIEIPDIDASWRVIADIRLLTVSCDSSSDNFGDMRVIDVTGGVQITPAAIKNTKSVVFEDVYSTSCAVLPQKEIVHISTLADTYTDLLEHSEKIRFELRGITDIVSSSLQMTFSNPEFSDGSVVIPARGVLNVLGMKENGESDSRTSQISLLLKAENIPPELFERKLRWLNFSTVCRHECDIMGGELVLKLWANESLAAFFEEAISVVTDFEKGEKNENNTCRPTFMIYYPEKGESVWKVAKDHGVSCERVCAENGIDGKTFDGKKTVVLR